MNLAAMGRALKQWSDDQNETLYAVVHIDQKAVRDCTEREFFDLVTREIERAAKTFPPGAPWTVSDDHGDVIRHVPGGLELTLTALAPKDRPEVPATVAEAEARRPRIVEMVSGRNTQLALADDGNVYELCLRDRPRRPEDPELDDNGFGDAARYEALYWRRLPPLPTEGRHG